LALALANRLDKPLVVVPPNAQAPHAIERVLIAMEGTPAKSRKAKAVIELAESAGIDLVVIHVDDEGTIPSFSDQVQHEAEAYAQEFLVRYAHGSPAARLEMRIGVPADEVLVAVDALHPDILAVGWPQTDDPRRGAVARELLERSTVPVLLLAIA
jgi:nucleotide-binding universal stress UspA family protein